MAKKGATGPKMDNIFLPNKTKCKKKKIAAAQLATRWTGNRSFFSVASVVIQKRSINKDMVVFQQDTCQLNALSMFISDTNITKTISKLLTTVIGKQQERNI